MENGLKDLFYQMQDVPDDRRRRYRPRLDAPSGLPPVIRNVGVTNHFIMDLKRLAALAIPA